jgi:hypothetical protein
MTQPPSKTASAATAVIQSSAKADEPLSAMNKNEDASFVEELPIADLKVAMRAIRTGRPHPSIKEFKRYLHGKKGVNAANYRLWIYICFYHRWIQSKSVQKPLSGGAYDSHGVTRLLADYHVCLEVDDIGKSSILVRIVYRIATALGA